MIWWEVKHKKKKGKKNPCESVILINVRRGGLTDCSFGFLLWPLELLRRAHPCRPVGQTCDLTKPVPSKYSTFMWRGIGERFHLCYVLGVEKTLEPRERPI